MKKTLTLLATAVLLSACAAPGVQIEGEIAAGGSGKTLLIEQVIPLGARVIDSVKTDRHGKFSYRIKEAMDAPSFFNLRTAAGTTVPLLVEKGEKVRVAIADSTARSYTVTGSEGSALVREINGILSESSARMAALEQEYYDTEDAQQMERIAREYAAAEIARKQAAAAFLARNAGSLAAIVPLYQPTAEGEFLFSEPEDVLYFRMVADSLEARYPASPFTRSVLSDTQGMENMVTARNMMEENLDNEIGFPDLNMPDILGKRHRLSDLQGKVILLSFTATNVAELNILNRELVETYEKYKDKGFEVYQVFLDRNKAEWVNSVAQQRLPWIAVSDLQGADSRAVTLYNVQKVPSNFLIDRQGNILQRDILPSDIDRAVAKAL